MAKNSPSSGQWEFWKTYPIRVSSTLSTSWSAKKINFFSSLRPARREASKISRASSSRTNHTNWSRKLCIKLPSAFTIWNRWVLHIVISSHPTSPSIARESWRLLISMRLSASEKMSSINKLGSLNSFLKKLSTSSCQRGGVGRTHMLGRKSTWVPRWGKGPAPTKEEIYGHLGVYCLSLCRDNPSWLILRKNLSCTTNSINIFRRSSTLTHPLRTCSWRFWY